MIIREIINLYLGEWFTVREHLDRNTAIAKFLYEYSRSSYISPKTDNEYIEIKDKYEGYIGDISEGRDISIAIAGTAEMLTKILIIEKLKLDEKKIYEGKPVQDAVDNLSDSMERLSFKELKILIEQIGEDRVEMLNSRLDEGYINSFYVYDDNRLQRALCLFQLMRFQKYGELKWFRYKNFLTNEEIKGVIEKLARRAANTILDMFDNEDADFFPRFGKSYELTVLADLRIGNKVILFSGFPKFDFESRVTKRNIAILNACYLLAQDSGDPIIKEKYIYYLRWNRLVKIT